MEISHMKNEIFSFRFASQAFKVQLKVFFYNIVNIFCFCIFSIHLSVVICSSNIKLLPTVEWWLLTRQ